jgi:hypothetical protein
VAAPAVFTNSRRVGSFFAAMQIVLSIMAMPYS